MVDLVSVRNVVITEGKSFEVQDAWSSFVLLPTKDKTLLENVQKFASRMAIKQWDSGYQDLLVIMNVPSLADHRLQLKLSLLYKIVHGMCYFPSDILCPRSSYSNRTNHSLVINQLFAHKKLTITPLYLIQFLHGTHYTKNM